MFLKDCLNNEKKKLIFFLPEFVCGGAGKSITSLCKNLNKKIFSITIICLNKCYYKNQLKKFCKIYEINSNKVIFAQNEIGRIIKKEISNNSDNIFISNLFHTNALTALFQSNHSNLKLIFTERTAFKELSIYFGFYDFIKKFIIKTILKFYYNKANLVIANSKKVATEIRNYTKVKTNYVYPGSFKKLVVKKNKYKKIYNIISIGRLSKEKGFDLLIKSFVNIDKKRYKLSIIGDGNEKKKIFNLIKNNKLEDNIKILGFKKDVYPYIKKADLLINSSYFEGFPNVVIEALSCSVPVICSRSHGGIYEILKNETYGDLFINGNTYDLEKKINNFFKDPTKLIKKCHKAKLDLQKFSEIKSAKKYENIFLNL